METAAAFGATTTVRIASRDFTIGPIDLDAMLALAGEMKKLAGDPFAAIVPRLAELPEPLAEKLFREALTRHNALAAATPQQALVWALDDPDGLAHLLWYLIERKQAGVISREHVILWLLEMRWGRPQAYAELIEQIGAAAGIPSLSKAAAAVHRAAADIMHQTTAGAGRSPGAGWSHQSNSAGSDSASPMPGH